MQSTDLPFPGWTPERFLDGHWQKQPLLIRGGMPDCRLPMPAGDLPSLAGDPQQPSRLVIAPDGVADWRTRRGPLSADDLAALPSDGWTILLHEMDRRFDAFAELLERFRFIPNWRIDDVMVSYARDGGGVGPHIDRYDVFLVQIAGRRRWRIGGSPLHDERWRMGLEHSVLETFDPAEEWILEPGDVLYLPPLFAHEGVAVGECVTCSVGFRAPDPRELCAGFLRQLGPGAFDAIRYADRDRQPCERPGELSEEARLQLRRSARSLFAEDGGFDRWIGRFVTTPSRGVTPSGCPMGQDELFRALDLGGTLRRSAPSHFAWFRDGDALLLFVGGEIYPLNGDQASFAETLCGIGPLDRETLGRHLQDGAHAAVVRDLLLRGFLEMREARPRKSPEV